MTSTAFSIRLLPQSEYPCLLPLLAAYAAEMRGVLHGVQQASPQHSLALLRGPVLQVLVAADAEGAAVGFALLCTLPEVVFARSCGQLEDLFVLPAARGQGLARRLIAAAEALGRGQGWSHLRWFVPGQDTAAIALYEKVAARTDWQGYILRLDPDASL